jgi:hypothetical protein
VGQGAGCAVCACVWHGGWLGRWVKEAQSSLAGRGVARCAGGVGWSGRGGGALREIKATVGRARVRHENEKMRSA